MPVVLHAVAIVVAPHEVADRQFKHKAEINVLFEVAALYNRVCERERREKEKERERDSIEPGD